MKYRGILRPICVLLILAALTGCAAPGAEAVQTTAATIPSTATVPPAATVPPTDTIPPTAVPTASSAVSTAPSETDGLSDTPPSAAGSYEIPPFRDAVFDPGAAETQGTVRADFSGLDKGYIAMEATSGKRLKFQVILNDLKYNYDLPSDGTPTVFPLSLGSGSYTFRVMENAAGSKYICIWKETREVRLADEFEPFLRPSQMSAYTESSQCVLKARELAASCDTDAEVASAIYEYLSETICYDYPKADSVQSGYLPDPDETLRTETGICFDYASLAAAMLRSLGVPCKLIVGYVRNGGSELYHAWNSFYLENQGWITVEIKAKPNIWQRVDITFAAAGVDTKSLTDDSLYTTRYTY